METVLIVMLAGGIGAALVGLVGPRRRAGREAVWTGAERNAVWSTMREAASSWRTRGQPPVTREIVEGALACARRDGTTGPMRMPARLLVAVHPDDYISVLDGRELVEKAVHRAAQQRRVRMSTPTRLHRVVRDDSVIPGRPDVEPVSADGLPLTREHTTDEVNRRRHPQISAAGPAPRAARLVTLRRPHLVYDVPAAGGTVGRDGNQCEITIDLPTVSRRHAELVRVRGGYTVIDHGSANGITINSRRTQRGRLGPGDTLGLGRAVLLQLELDDDG